MVRSGRFGGGSRIVAEPPLISRFAGVHRRQVGLPAGGHPQDGPGKRARAAEWDTLLMCCARKGTEGSNPSASALDLGFRGPVARPVRSGEREHDSRSRRQPDRDN